MFLIYLGEDAYDVCEHTFEEIITLLDNYFQPKTTTSYETYIFRQLKQNTDDTITQYYLRLKEQAAKCNFDNKDREIKQQIEQHCKQQVTPLCFSKH